MKALRIDGIGSNTVFETEPQDLGPGDVRVKIHFVGLCGSDLNTFRGLNPLAGFPGSRVTRPRAWSSGRARKFPRSSPSAGMS